MPSIPQSLLWISLVLLWLFVLVPMLVSKRDAVRRTSDLALATRVLNGGANSRLVKRGGPAAGHRSDPDWKPEATPAEDELADVDADHDNEHDNEQGREDDREHGDADTAELRRPRPVVVPVAVPEPSEPDYLDVDVIEDCPALPSGTGTQVNDDTASVPERADREPDDEYEYAEDSSGLEPDAESRDDQDRPSRPTVALQGSRRRRFDTRTAAAVSARKYAFRKRVLMVMAMVLVGSATAAFKLSPDAWWLCGTATVVTLLYLAYLRRQTRIEERVRRRRTQRMARARLGVENAHDRQYDRQYDGVPSRLRRPGGVVLEIDDEDPIFEHLDYAMAMRPFGWPRDLPRAVGE
ncbi:MAG: hypothetical protein PHQ28_14435 [Mycobacterium sp.]|nr:hypothetical protein [Mycobacterium sp.]